jgi:hypothetical protein
MAMPVRATEDARRGDAVARSWYDFDVFGGGNASYAIFGLRCGPGLCTARLPQALYTQTTMQLIGKRTRTTSQIWYF